MPYIGALESLQAGFNLAARWLSRDDSEVSEGISDVKKEENNSQDDVATTFMHRVVARSSGIGSEKEGTDENRQVKLRSHTSQPSQRLLSS